MVKNDTYFVLIVLVAKSPKWIWLEVRRGGGEEIPLLQDKEQWLHGHRRAERSHSALKIRRGSGEEIPLLQDKEQWLRFAGTAVKRYPTSRGRETQVRW